MFRKSGNLNERLFRDKVLSIKLFTAKISRFQMGGERVMKSYRKEQWFNCNFFLAVHAIEHG